MQALYTKNYAELIQNQKSSQKKLFFSIENHIKVGYYVKRELRRYGILP